MVDPEQVLMEFYQGEIRRLNRESQRLDSYANWAFLITGTIITIGFSFWVGVIGKFYNPQYKNYGIPLQGLPITEPLHWIFPLGISLMFIICFIDSRKYRFFLLFRARVNLTLEHYIKPKLNGEDVNIRCIFRKHLKKYIEMSSSWEEALPKEFGFWKAFMIRMFRVYGWLIFLLLFAWLLGLAGAFWRLFDGAFWQFFFSPPPYFPFIPGKARGFVFFGLLIFTPFFMIAGGLYTRDYIERFKKWIRRRVRRFKEELNKNEAYEEAAKDWEGLLFTIMPDRGLDSEYAFYMDLWHGKCRACFTLLTQPWHAFMLI